MEPDALQAIAKNASQAATSISLFRENDMSFSQGKLKYRHFNAQTGKVVSKQNFNSVSDSRASRKTPFPGQSVAKTEGGTIFWFGS